MKYHGILVFEDNQPVFKDGQRIRHFIQPDQAMEIKLSGCWIQGSYSPSYGDTEEVEAHNFKAGVDHTRCGLIEGMAVGTEE